MDVHFLAGPLFTFPIEVSGVSHEFLCYQYSGMEYWESYYANYPGYPPYPPPGYPPCSFPPGPPPQGEYSLSGASHLRVSDTESDSGSPSRVKRNVHTSASKYAAVSCGSDSPTMPQMAAKATPQSRSEVSCITTIGFSVMALCVCVHVCVCGGGERNQW